MTTVWAIQIEYKVKGNIVRRSHFVHNTNEITTLEKHLKGFGGGVVHKRLYVVSDWVEVLDEVEKEIEAKKMQLEKQSDLTSVIIDKWHTKKKDDINTNPESFYTED